MLAVLEALSGTLWAATSRGRGPKLQASASTSPTTRKPTTASRTLLATCTWSEAPTLLLVACASFLGLVPVVGLGCRAQAINPKLPS